MAILILLFCLSVKVCDLVVSGLKIDSLHFHPKNNFCSHAKNIQLPFSERKWLTRWRRRTRIVPVLGEGKYSGTKCSFRRCRRRRGAAFSFGRFECPCAGPAGSFNIYFWQTAKNPSEAAEAQGAENVYRTGGYMLALQRALGTFSFAEAAKRWGADVTGITKYVGQKFRRGVV